MRERALIAEDNDDMRDLLQEVLEDAGYETLVAANGRQALAILTAYSWPGNVRELENAIERAVAFARGPAITPDDLPERVSTSGSASALIARSVEQNMTMREVEREYILEVLRRTGGNKSRAAELLGLDRKTLYRRLDEYRAEGAPVP
jgi:DNA-binding NtrC family response regulator